MMSADAGNPAMVGKAHQSECRKTPGWAPFDSMARKYDRWFDDEKGRRVFNVEVACIRQLLENAPRPWLEVGVGTGRFAEALGIDEGLDPSPAALAYAERRRVRTKVGRAEDLPFDNGAFGTVILVVTICFVENPEKTLKECRRVLKGNGCLVVGLVPKNSSWGEAYARKGAEGHPFYSVARFYSAHQVIAMTERAGFALGRARSCLFEDIEASVDKYERPREGLIRKAGFVGMRFEINGKNGHQQGERTR